MHGPQNSSLLPQRKEILKFQGISWWPLVDAVGMGVALLAIGHNTWNSLAIMDCTYNSERKILYIKPDDKIKMESDIQQFSR